LAQTFFQYSGVDLDGDGDVDWRDRMRAFKMTGQSFEMLYETLEGVLPLLLLGVGGFAILWWLGFIQPILSQLIVYMYFGLLITGFLATFVFKIWRNLNASILQFFEQFKNFEHQAEDILQDIPEHITRVFNEWRNGEQPGTPFEDRTLANLKRDPFLTKPEQPSGSLADVNRDPFLTADTQERRRILGMLCEFAEVLLDKFKDVNDAFNAFDTNKNGLLTKKEFKDGVRSLPQFTGDPMAVFRALDPGVKSGRPMDRLTKRDFKKLTDAHEQQADAKAQLEDAKNALQMALGTTQPTDVLFAEPSETSRGGLVWAVHRALDNARSRAVARPCLLEAEHTLYEAGEVRILDFARQAGDSGALSEAILQAKQKGVPKVRVDQAEDRLAELRTQAGE